MYDCLELAEPKYINSTSTSTSINPIFLIPGHFQQLIVQIPSIGKNCSTNYLSTNPPFYNCPLHNLPPRESFDLTYYSVGKDNQKKHGVSTTVAFSM